MEKRNIIKLGVEVTKERNNSSGVEKELLDVVSIILAHIARPDIGEYKEKVKSMGLLGEEERVEVLV